MDPQPLASELPERISLDGLLALVGSLETSRLDVKRKPARLDELIPAFAMTDGGLIVLGVDDRRSLVPGGCRLDQKTYRAITDVARSVGVDVNVREVEVDGEPVVLVSVPEVRGRIVTTPNGRLLHRVGDQVTPLVGDRLAWFVRERTDVAAEDEVVRDARFDEGSVALVNAALRADGRPDVDADDLPRALADLHLAERTPAGTDVLAAAVVLFGTDPRTVIAGAAVQFVRRSGVGPGPGPTTRRTEIAGPLPSVVDRCLDEVNATTQRFEVVTGRRREFVPTYPERALREALLNALAHRDYSLAGATVDVTVWDDRVEIRSPGPLPGPITLDNIRTEHYSRNRRVMRCLKQLGLVEEYGEGVDRMFDEMAARLMLPPQIDARERSVTVTLFNRFLVSIEDQVWLANLGRLDISRDERLALVLARREGSVTPRRLREVASVDDVDTAIRAAVAKNLLVRVGTRGGTRYEMSPELVQRTGTSGIEARSRRRQALLDHARSHGSIATREGAGLTGDDARVVRLLLADLVAAGSLVAVGERRGRRYLPR